MSNFSPGHRINLAASYRIDFSGNAGVTLSAFYNGQTGRPYAYRFGNDVNGDAGTTNDLLYIPRDANDVIVVGGTFDQLSAFLDDGSCDALAAGLDRRAQLVPRPVDEQPRLPRRVRRAVRPLQR